MNDTGLSDEILEVWLLDAAAVYEVPAGAAALVLSTAGEDEAPRARRLPHPRLVAAGLLIVAAVGGSLLWGAGGHPRQVDDALLTRSAALPPHTSAGSATANGAEKALAGVSPVKGRGHLATSATDGAKVVHTGSLTLEAPKGQVSAVLTRLTGLATGVGGYVSTATTAEAGSQPSGTVVLRVPAAAYDGVLTQARALGTVISTASSATDVTGQAADQQARLAALKATRDQFLTLLTKAKTIGETLAVQQRVDDAQTQIDQLQGQINVLADQASYGSLTVTVSQHVAASIALPSHRQSGLSTAWHRAVTGFVTGVEALLARSGRALVVVLVLLAAAVLGRVAWRVARRRLV